MEELETTHLLLTALSIDFAVRGRRFEIRGFDAR